MTGGYTTQHEGIPNSSHTSSEIIVHILFLKPLTMSILSVLPCPSFRRSLAFSSTSNGTFLFQEKVATHPDLTSQHACFKVVRRLPLSPHCRRQRRPRTYTNMEMKRSNNIDQSHRHHDHHDFQVQWAQLTKPLSIEVSQNTFCVFAISDLHTDNLSAQDWVKRLPNYKKQLLYPNCASILIVAGDISSDPEILLETLEILSDKFDIVSFVIGNHDLWVEEKDREIFSTFDSIHKMQFIMEECHGRKANIYCNTALMVNQRLRLVPLLSWYHYDFDREQDFQYDDEDLDRCWTLFKRRWGDFSRCVWPEWLCSRKKFISTDNKVLAEFFASLNHHVMKWLDQSIVMPRTDLIPTITFSHFLPRPELLPEKRFLLEPLVAKVVGSDLLERQIREIEPDLHVMGHSHIPIDIIIEDIRYLEWCLGTVKQHQLQCKPIFDSGPLLVYSDHPDMYKDIKATVSTKWGFYYRNYDREPENMTSAPWALESHQKRAKMSANKK